MTRADGGTNRISRTILVADKGWELVGEGYGFTEGAAVNAKGEVFFNAPGKSKTYKVGPDGKPFADSLQSLTTSNVVYYPPQITELGSASTGNVWTGTDTTGAPTTNCTDWTSTAATDLGNVGFRVGGSEAWAAGFSLACNAVSGLYCFETDFAVAVLWTTA